MNQILSVIGAIIILAAYLGVQVKLLEAGRPLFSLLNLVGATLLAYIAVVEEQVGFALLEGAWAVISAFVLYRSLTGHSDETLVDRRADS